MPILAQYTFTGSVYAPETVATGLSATHISNGGLTNLAFYTSGYASQPALSALPLSGVTSAAATVGTNSYFYLTLTPDSGKKLNLDILTFKAARGGSSAPRGFVLHHSADAYASTLLSTDVPTVRPKLTSYSIDLSGLGEITAPLTLRFYIYAPNATSTVVEFDDFVVNGTVADVAAALNLELFMGAA